MITEMFHQLMAGRAVGLVGAWLGQTTFDGKWVFVGALGLVLIWLLAMPRSLIGQSKAVPPWWRNVRVWAIVICLFQIWIYWQFG